MNNNKDDTQFEFIGALSNFPAVYCETHFFTHVEKRH